MLQPRVDDAPIGRGSYNRSSLNMGRAVRAGVVMMECTSPRVSLNKRGSGNLRNRLHELCADARSKGHLTHLVVSPIQRHPQ